MTFSKATRLALVAVALFIPAVVGMGKAIADTTAPEARRVEAVVIGPTKTDGSRSGTVQRFAVRLEDGTHREVSLHDEWIDKVGARQGLPVTLHAAKGGTITELQPDPSLLTPTPTPNVRLAAIWSGLIPASIFFGALAVITERRARLEDPTAAQAAPPAA